MKNQLGADSLVAGQDGSTGDGEHRQYSSRSTPTKLYFSDGFLKWQQPKGNLLRTFQTNLDEHVYVSGRKSKDRIFENTFILFHAGFEIETLEISKTNSIKGGKERLKVNQTKGAA